MFLYNFAVTALALFANTAYSELKDEIYDDALFQANAMVGYENADAEMLLRPSKARFASKLTRVEEACAWRQTGDCSPTGPREPAFDKSCTEQIPSDHSGYCDCNGNGALDEGDHGYNCDSTPNVCAEVCQACAWRQTGDCSPTGPREPAFDKSCTEQIPSDHSGYCDCNGNGAMDEGDHGYNCDSTPNVCAEVCQGCDESLSGDGEDYRGCQDRTINGRICQKWTSQSPHTHGNTVENKPDSGLGDHNYCRNPDGYHTIWCYTLDPDVRFEECTVLVPPTPSPTESPTPLPTAPIMKQCVRVRTWSGTNDDGYLSLWVAHDGSELTIASDEYYGRGVDVLDRCYDGEVEYVKLGNTNTNAWVGFVWFYYSLDGVEQDGHYMYCYDCSRNGVAHIIAVDGDSNSGDLANVQCFDGKNCTLREITPSPTPQPGAPTIQQCVRVTTGSGTDADGYLSMFVEIDGGVVEIASDRYHGKGVKVLDECYEGEVEWVELRNKRDDSWVGTVYFFYRIDGAEQDGHYMYCYECSRNGTANEITVDGNADSGDDAITHCFDGSYCRMRRTITLSPTASPTLQAAPGPVLSDKPHTPLQLAENSLGDAGGSMRFDNILEDGTQLVMENVTEYTPYKQGITGLTAPSSSLAQISLACGDKVEMVFNFVLDSQPQVVETLNFTVADLDQGTHNRCTEAVEVLGYTDYSLYPSSSIQVDNETTPIRFVGTAAGSSTDNPVDIETMTEEQKSRAVSFFIQKRESFTVLFSTSEPGVSSSDPDVVGYKGRRILFGFGTP